MDLYSVPPLFLSLIALLLGLIVFIKKAKTPESRVYAALCFETFWWQICWFISFYLSTPQEKDIIVRTGYSLILFLPCTHYHFVCRFLKLDREIRWVGYSYLFGLFWLVLTWTSNLFIAGHYQYSWGMYGKAGILHPLYLAIVTVILARTLWILKESFIGARQFPIKRNQNKFVFSATTLYFVAAIEYSINYGFGLYPIGGFFIMAAFGVIGYAIVRYRLMDINIMIGKGLVYIISMGIVCCGMWILTLISNIFLFNIFDAQEITVFLALTAVVYTISILLYPRFLSKLETSIRGFLYKDKYKYQDKLREVAGTIPTIYDMERLLKYTVDKTTDALSASPCSIMLMDDINKIYSVNYSVGLKEDVVKEMILFPDTEIIQKLRWGNRILVREELAEDEPVRERMASIKSEVCVPIVRKDKLLGVLNFNHKASGDIYSHEDLSILLDIAKFLGMAIENINLNKEKESIAIARNRLDVTTSMAYGVADRIRNYIVPAAAYFDLFPDRFEKISGKLTPEEKDIVTSIFKSGQESVQKTVKLARETADMCSPQSYKPERCEPKVIIDLAKKLTAELKSDMRGKKIKITKEMTGKLPCTYFDKEAVKKVLFHLMQNSIHAVSVGKKGVIAVKITGTVVKNEKEYLRITVSDNGTGIPKENTDNIFNPFFTTKGTAGGTGLGLTICQFIISRHNGGIGVLNSKLDKGTMMYFDLPIIKELPKKEIDYKDILGQFPARMNKNILPDEIKDIIDKIKDSPRLP